MIWRTSRWLLSIALRLTAAALLVPGFLLLFIHSNFIGFVTILLVTMVLLYFARLLTVHQGDRAFLSDPRPPVVYLRSFQSDEGKILSSWWRPIFLLWRFGMVETEEEALARVLHKIGPFVAIGEPHEWLPTTGALRLYRRDDEWKNTVQDLLKRACLVIIRVGDTPGLFWELETVDISVYFKRVVFWKAEYRFGRKHKQISVAFSHEVKRIFDLKRLPDMSSPGFYVLTGVGENTRPRRPPKYLFPVRFAVNVIRTFTGGRKAVEYQKAIQPVLTRLSLGKAKIKINKIEIVNVIAVLLLVVLIVIFLEYPYYIVASVLVIKHYVSFSGNGAAIRCQEFVGPSQDDCLSMVRMGALLMRERLIRILILVEVAWYVQIIILIFQITFSILTKLSVIIPTFCIRIARRVTLSILRNT